jgi:hypothetical protein
MLRRAENPVLRRVLAIGLAGTIASVLLSACTAQTDRQRYAIGDSGVASFSNHLDQTVYLGGCFPFVFEKLEEGDWISRGAPVICFWEGVAQPVAPGEQIDTAFDAPREPGAWRLSYPVGLRCNPGQPLGANQCAIVGDLPSAPFAVVAECRLPAGCGPPLGMPNWLCTDGSTGGPTDRCLESTDGESCFWEIRDCPEDD